MKTYTKVQREGDSNKPRDTLKNVYIDEIKTSMGLQSVVRVVINGMECA